MRKKKRKEKREREEEEEEEETTSISPPYDRTIFFGGSSFGASQSRQRERDANHLPPQRSVSTGEGRRREEIQVTREKEEPKRLVVVLDRGCCIIHVAAVHKAVTFQTVK